MYKILSLLFLSGCATYTIPQPTECVYDKALVITLNNNGSGSFQACSNYQTILTGKVSAGIGKFKTPTGNFQVQWQAKKYTSKKYPNDDNTSNMNYATFFQPGIATHIGDINKLSHGCVHMTSKDAQFVYYWLQKGDKIIIKDQNVRN